MMHSRLLQTIFLCVFIASQICQAQEKVQPPSKRASSLMGYALPWDWDRVDSQHFADVLYSAGCTATLIEIDNKRDPSFVASWVKPFRGRGITVEVVVMNSNTLSLHQLPVSWFENYLIELEKVLNPKGVILQPVSEPGNRGGDREKIEHWIEFGLIHWPGPTALSIGWPWGDRYKNKATYWEEHWCRDFSEKTIRSDSKYINTTDCSTMIDISADRVYQLAKIAVKKKANFIYYHGNPKGPLQMDKEKIKALARAIQES
ncbi:MAG: hypothetical protein HYS08_04925 [Chlamydiae bacterium]|nr:hypothetical protein [Chlamydiota bacterium]MBI3267094.1 hypothetical protein [Chlamydiota bacterium]